MAWTDLPSYTAGCIVNTTMINNIINDIAVLALHDHSGSSGDGSASLSSNVRLTNTGTIYPRDSGGIYVPVCYPASSYNWSNIGNQAGVLQADTAPKAANMSISVDNASLGACLVYTVYYSTISSGSFIIYTSVDSNVGASSGCLVGSVNGSTMFTTSCPNSTLVYSYTLPSNIPTSGSLQILYSINNKGTCGIGFGAMLRAIYIYNSNT